MRTVPVGVSARHIHLTQDHVEQLFGEGAVLTPLKPLVQPGQFASNETVTIIGPTGSFDRVRILGPTRKKTQIEISRTDTFVLGVPAPLRESGKLAGSGAIKLQGPRGELMIEEGVIVAVRHIHFHTSDANKYHISDKQLLRVQVGGQRGIVFNQVIARVSDHYRLEMHIDTDEANAAGIEHGDHVEILA